MSSQNNRSSPKILYIAVHSHHGWGAEYWLSKSFNRLGISLMKLDYREIRSNGGYKELRFQIDKMLDWCDVIFVQRGDNIPSNVFKGISKPIIFWSTELLHRRRDVNQLLKKDYFSWLFVHTHRCLDIINKKFKHFNSIVSVLHNATPQEQIVDTDFNREYFAIFNRSLSSRRKKWLKPSLDLVDVKTGRYGNDYFNDLKLSSVAVNIHYSNNIDFETGIFEALSAGCVVVSETLDQNTLLDLNLKHVIIEVSTPMELNSVLLELKQNPTLLKNYRIKSLEAIKTNTWDQRAQDILNVIEFIR